MVSENSFRGAYKLNPFNFDHFDLRKVFLVANGETYPKRGRPLNVCFTGNRPNDYTQLYVQMYEALGLAGTNKSIGLNFSDIKQGNCLVVVDLTADSGTDDSAWETVRSGNTSVNIELGTPVHADTGGVRVICMGEFDNLMTVDARGNVYSDFAV